jgi:sugar phosphate isomerase/epimerase
MIKLGTTTISLTGWLVDPHHPAESRERHLTAIRQITAGYHLAAVELTLDLMALYPQVFDASFYQEVATLQQEMGFTCTAHLPFLWVDLASLNEPIRRASVACLQEAVALCRAVQVQSYVVHLWGSMTTLIAAQMWHPTQRGPILEALMGQAGRSLAELGRLVEPGRLCVENLEDPLFDVALPLVERHGTGICLDVGHLIWQGGDLQRFLEGQGSRVHEVHLHDAAVSVIEGQRQARDHLALGKGQVDYPGLLRALEEMDFQGVVILEVNTRADLEQSLERLRSMPPAPDTA